MKLCDLYPSLAISMVTGKEIGEHQCRWSCKDYLHPCIGIGYMDKVCNVWLNEGGRETKED